MKRKVFFVAIWIIGFFLSSFLYLPKTQAFPLDYQFKAEVNSSIETLQVFYLLKYQSGYSQCEYENTIFKKLSLEWFTPYSSHKAVEEFNQNISAQYTQEELINLFSQISFTTGLFDLTYPSLKNDPKLSAWMRDVNDFMTESQSETFFSRMQDYYNLLPTTISPRTSFITSLERVLSFFNVKDCKVYITPTLMHQYYLISNHYNDEITFTIILGLQSIQNGYITFTTSDLQQELLYTTLMNQCLELSLQPFQRNIENYSELWPSIQDSMRRDQIETWSKAFQEHVRIGLLYKLFPESYTVNLYQHKTESGYQYLPFTAGVIEEYLRQRTYFQSFDSLMTKVLIRFSKYLA